MTSFTQFFFELGYYLLVKTNRADNELYCAFDPSKICCASICGLYLGNLMASVGAEELVINNGGIPMSHREYISYYNSLPEEEKKRLLQKHVVAWKANSLGCPNFDPNSILKVDSPIK